MALLLLISIIYLFYLEKYPHYPPLPWWERAGVRGVRYVHPSPSQRLSLRGRSPSLRAGGLSEPEAGAEPEPAATLPLPHQGGGEMG